MLHWAVENSDIEIVEVFLESDAKVDERDEHNGHTPLHLAAIYDQVEAINILIYRNPCYRLGIEYNIKKRLKNQ